MNSILSAANRSLAYLEQSLRPAPPQLRNTASIALLRTQREYASSVWNPHLAYQINGIK